MSKRLRKGDEVLVISGNDRGKRGKIQAKSGERVLVEGVNICKRTVKKSQQHPNGGFVTMERPVHISNVRLLGKDDKPVRLRAQVNKKGEKEFYYIGADKKAVVHRAAKEGKKG